MYLICIITLAYSSFIFALVITHEGPHHHQSRGLLSEMYTAVQDTFHRRPVAATPEEEEKLPTLREFLSDPEGLHTFAPAFVSLLLESSSITFSACDLTIHYLLPKFGFFAYFGALGALEEQTRLIVPKLPVESQGEGNSTAITCANKSALHSSSPLLSLVRCCVNFSTSSPQVCGIIVTLSLTSS